MQKAYSILQLKDLQDDSRFLSGIATTPTADRVGDILDPRGAVYAKEIPLLWQHGSDLPVGVAWLGEATDDGIGFSAEVANIPDEGDMKSLTDKAWHSVKYNLVRAVSVGFRVLDGGMEKIKGGFRFFKFEIHELSLVTIPANSEAVIQVVRSLCQRDETPALGEHAVPVADVNRRVGATTRKHVVIRLP